MSDIPADDRTALLGHNAPENYHDDPEHQANGDGVLGWRQIGSGWWSFVVAVFMIGSAADYYDGASFGAGFSDIGALYKQAQSAAWLLVAYATVSAAMQPVYSILCMRFDWTWPLLGAYLAFALGQTIAYFSGFDTDLRGSQNDFHVLVPLLFARMVTTIGACAMVYIPNLVLNVLAPEDERAAWEGIQAIANFLGQWLGRETGSSGFSNFTQFHRTFLQQLPIPIACFSLLATCYIYGVYVMPPSYRNRASLRVSRQADDVASAGSVRSFATAQEISSVILLTLGVGGVCISLGVFARYFLLPENQRGLDLVPATLCPLLLGSFSLFAVVANEKNMRGRGIGSQLYPFDLTPSVKKTIGFIYLLTLLKNFTIVTINFVLPWYSSASSTPKEWLFHWLDVGVTVGSAVTGLVLKKWMYREQRSLVSPKRTAIIASAASVIAAVGMAANWGSIKHVFLSHVTGFTLYLGDSALGAVLLPCLLNELGVKKQRFQAIVYCGLHLVGNVAFSMTVTLSNIVLQLLADYYMRAYNVADEDIESCFADLRGCLETLDPKSQAAVRQAFLKTSFWFACTASAGTIIILALVLCLLKDYDLSTRRMEANDAEAVTDQD